MSTTNLSTQDRDRLDAYLQIIEHEMQGRDPGQLRDIVSMVNEHVAVGLADNPGASLQDLLVELGPARNLVTQLQPGEMSQLPQGMPFLAAGLAVIAVLMAWPIWPVAIVFIVLSGIALWLNRRSTPPAWRTITSVILGTAIAVSLFALLVAGRFSGFLPQDQPSGGPTMGTSATP